MFYEISIIYFLNEEIEITFFQNTALHIAVEKKNKEIIKLLLSHKNINAHIKSRISIF